MSAPSPDVVAVIGGGPAGLAAAAALKPLGLHVRVLEKTDAVGARWRGHYDRLRLHTTRRMSALPGLEIPVEYGRWVSRDDFVRYQERYVAHHGIEVEFGTAVERADRVDERWRLATSKGVVDARYVVVGAGYNNAPFLPRWPGRDGFTGELAHSRDYRSGAKYERKRVLVVGTGNSGAEIATDLAEHGAEVSWSFRTPPTILPRAVLGVATQALGILLRPLPATIVDPTVAAFGRIVVGDLAKYGLPRPTRGAYTAVLRDHVLPILDVGLVSAIKGGRVRPVGAVASFEGADVVLADGQRLTPDAVVACTGFRPALEPVLGHLGVLGPDGGPLVHGADEHPNATNMFFLGYSNAVSGNLREIAIHARQLGQRVGSAVAAAA
ncbi:MAG TPA: NAD(P)-binding domain-containing protein [Polyangiaceae bacterium]|jgi:NADPH-dependent 2,4-dienoyl-CoA reductase/sulfur reductase-like enzyme